MSAIALLSVLAALALPPALAEETPTIHLPSQARTVYLDPTLFWLLIGDALREALSKIFCVNVQPNSLRCTGLEDEPPAEAEPEPPP
jgi:hypothetical protein